MMDGSQSMRVPYTSKVMASKSESFSIMDCFWHTPGASVQQYSRYGKWTRYFFYSPELLRATSAGPLIRPVLPYIRAVKSSILERNFLRIGDVFAL